MVSGTYGQKREVQVQKIESNRLWRTPKLQVKVHSVGQLDASSQVYFLDEVKLTSASSA